MPIEVEIVDRKLLVAEERVAMKALYDRYYTGGAPHAFFRDLAQKDWVIVLKTGRSIVGFSTQKLYIIDTGEHIIFSGDTVVDQSVRNQAGLAGGFGHLMRFLYVHHAPAPIYWFLISKGARTYRFLPTFFNRYHPGIRPEPELSALVDRIATTMHPMEYDRTTGVLHFHGGKDRLRSDELRSDPHSLFFRKRNPGWTIGDELCCLLPANPENLNRRGMRVIESIHVTWRLEDL